MQFMWSDFALLKRSILLASLFLMMLSVALGVEMVKAYIRAQATTPVSLELAPPSPMPEPPRPAAVEDYQIIVKRNLFNAHPLKEPRQPQNPPPSDNPPRQVIPLQLKLVGAVTNAHGQPYALIEDLRQQGAQAVYQVGETIQSALLVDIHPTCIVLAQGGQEAWLCLQPDEGMVKTPRSRPVLPSAASHSTDDSGAS